jgi:hypothetical protein
MACSRSAAAVRWCAALSAAERVKIEAQASGEATETTATGRVTGMSKAKEPRPSSAVTAIKTPVNMIMF